MKTLYLLILRKYKIWIVIGYTIVTFVGLYIQSLMSLITIDTTLGVFLSFFLCMYAWFNGTFTFVFAIEENSSHGEVIRRWLVIVLSFMLHVYMIFAPIF